MSIGNSGGGGGGGESGVISHTEDQFGEKRKKEVASRRSVEPVVMAHTAHNNKRGSSLSLSLSGVRYRWTVAPSFFSSSSSSTVAVNIDFSKAENSQIVTA